MGRRRFTISKLVLFQILSITFSVVCVLAMSEIRVDHLPRKLIPHVHSGRNVLYSPELGLITNKPDSKQVVSSPWVYNYSFALLESRVCYC